MNANSLKAPFAFSPLLDVKPGDGEPDPVDWSCSLAVPSCLESWGRSAAYSEGSTSSLSLALGCEDGTFYLFHESVPPPQVSRRRSSIESSASRPPRLSNSSRPTSPLRYGGLGVSNSRSGSPSSARSALSPFQVSRTRAVSSVTTEQAEAPKNYVDFDEETERMKGMLKGKGVREKTPGELLSPNSERGTSLEKSGEARSPRLRALSPTSSIKSTSGPPPPSPIITPLDTPTASSTLSLTCHVFPPKYGYLHAVRAIKPYDSGRYLVCLQEAGNISIHATSDGSCIVTAAVDSEHPTPIGTDFQLHRPAPALWLWKSLRLGILGESNIILACASSDESSGINQLADGLDDEHEEHTRLVAYAIHPGPHNDGREMNLVKLGDWCIDGTAEGVGLHQRPDGSLTVFNVSSTRCLTLRSLVIAETVAASETEKKDTGSRTVLPLPKTLKDVLKVLSRERVEDTDKEDETLVRLGDAVELGPVSLNGMLSGMRSFSDGDKVRVGCWSDSELVAFGWHGEVYEPLFAQNIEGIRDIDWTTAETPTILFSDRVEYHSIVTVDANNDIIADAGKGKSQVKLVFRLELVRSVPLALNDFSAITSTGDVFATDVRKGKRRLERAFPESDIAAGNASSRQVWKARCDSVALSSAVRITCTLPVELSVSILGCSDGRLRRSSFLGLSRKGTDRYTQVSNVPLQGEIVSLHLVDNERTKERLVIGGADDGSMAIWDLQSLSLRARWTMFTEPLAQVVHLKGDSIGRLRGCTLCISQDGTIAVIAIDGYQFIFLVPTSSAPLKQVHVGGNNLMLLYRDGRARLWDSKTQEFWRSMNADRTDEMLKQGGWTSWSVGDATPSFRSIVSPLHASVGVDSGCTILLDVEAAIRQSSPSLAEAASTDKASYAGLDPIRAVLSALLTFGLNKEIDSICRDKLRVDRSGASVGLYADNALCLYSEKCSVWTVSTEVSGLLALALIAMLQTLLRHEELVPDTTTVMTFYAASLPEVLGASYKSPSLRVLAKHWLQSTVNEVKSASRLLMDAGIARMSDLETAETIEYWQPYLPCVQDEANRDNLRCAMALHICGSIAIEKYALLFTSALTDIAKSIDIYLHEEASPYRALAIDLCSRGFQVWQQHTDAVEMLRALFLLATSAKKEAISPHNVGSQARSAVLNIASSNTPLFITTLTIDILHPRSVQHRKSVMQLVIFIIRKKPLVLYSNLPRLVEAVVKSLDPNSTANRDAILDFATEILGQFVRTFPTVDFHMATQRLAVGTSEGAVVMYDLKTATRLYVLEGHKKRTTACSFSPDGRRLVTVSLEESSVLVWKVGASFTSFFTPGAPPRQGHAGSEPFKTLSFNVGGEARMSLAATLENVRFEWAGDRSVKLKIRESTLTFST
ncbi:WD40 repeat-like protein [Fomitopsis serialis]|uniref:WD40 repeat-like protein n=1 Tax=Fomitopsis serialis TaxID=139415 RepID=UPI002007EA46|nr:WD40 repeat-like protein [Neoantrodia serialis]KAH9922915.1 WD40 repeat-like protein [Neoantrodia serialis]